MGVLTTKLEQSYNVHALFGNGTWPSKPLKRFYLPQESEVTPFMYTYHWFNMKTSVIRNAIYAFSNGALVYNILQ